MLPNAHKQSISEVLSQAFSVYRRSLWDVLPLSLLCSIIVTWAFINIPSTDFLSPGYVMAIIVGHWMSFLGYFLVSLFCYSAMVHCIHAGMQTKPAHYGVAFLQSLKTLPFILIASLVFISGATLGVMAWIIPGLILSVAFCFYYPLILVDHEKPLRAFIRSGYFVWGNWWRTLLVFSIPSLLFIGFFSVMEILLDSLFNYALVANGFIKILMGAFFTPLFIAVILQQLNDLKARKEDHMMKANV